MRMLVARIKFRPDVYIITFRGYEFLPFALILSAGKPLIFDEFINPIEWVAYEHKKIRVDGSINKILLIVYRSMLHFTFMILTDTKSHMEFSSNINRVNENKYFVLPVSTDEKTFFPKELKPITGNFSVFYYGNMLPLHGIKYVCEAAVDFCKLYPESNFVIIGGNLETEKLISESLKKGASINFKRWVDYNKLPDYIEQSDVCLGGPFGNTVQANMVITGKTFQFLASAKPTIIGQINEKLKFKNKENAIIVDQGSTKSILDALDWSINHRKELLKIGLNGNKLYKNNYSSEKISILMKQLLSILT